MSLRKAIWKTDTQFNFGTPVLSGVAIIGEGENAYLALEKKENNNNNIAFSNSDDYVLSDNSKLEITNGKARLKAYVDNDNNWPFTNSANYNYDDEEIEVLEGKAELYGSPIVPYAYYKLNESSGETALDSSGNGRNGTLINMEDSDWQVGKLNNCLYINEGGTINEYINCGSIADFEYTDTFSLECWIKTSDNTFGIISKYSGVGWTMHFENTIIFRLYDNNSNVITRKSLSAINDNSWHHIICTYDGSGTAAGMHVYIDGSLNEQSPTGGPINSSIKGGGNCQLGALSNYGNFRLVGKLDECIIYEKELTQGEVQIRYNSGNGTESMPGSYSILNPIIETKNGWDFDDSCNVFIEDAIKPTNTEIKYIISIDGGITYKYWDGNSWVESNGSYSQSNTASEINLNLSSIGDNGTVKIKAFLHTSDNSYTPTLNNIYIAENATYSTEDNLYIETNNNSQISPELLFNWISLLLTYTVPSETDIKLLFSIDGKNSWLGLDGETWTIIEENLLRENGISIEEAINNFSNLPIGNKILNIRLFLYTSNSTKSPEIDNINVTSNAGYETEGIYESIEYQPTPSYFKGILVHSINYDIEIFNNTNIEIQTREVNTILENNYITYNNSSLIQRQGELIQWKGIMKSNGEFSPKINFVEVAFRTLIPNFI